MSEEQTGTHKRWPRRLAITMSSIVIALLLTLGALSALLATDAGSRWLVNQLVSLTSNEQQQLSFERMEGTLLRGLDLHQVSFIQGPNSLELERLHSRWNPFTLLSGEFSLQALHLQGMDLDWPGRDSPGPDSQSVPLSQTLDAILPLPVNLGLDDARVEQATLRLGGGQWQIDSLRFSVSLNGRRAALQSLRLETPEANLDGGLSATLASPFELEASLDWRYRLPESAAVSTASGSLQLEGNLNELQIEHRLDEPMNISSDGPVQLGLADMLDGRSDELALTLELVHELTGQTLPLEGMSEYRIMQAEVRTGGPPGDLDISGEADVSAPVLPDGPLTASLQWQSRLSGAALDLRSLTLETSSGTLQADGRVDWQDEPLVDLALQLEENRPEAYWSGFPSAVELDGLNGSAGLRLRLGADGPQGALSLETLQGRLNGHELDVALELLFEGSRLEMPSMTLTADENRLQGSASWAQGTLDGRMQLEAPQLEIFYPGLSGALQSELRFTAGERPLSLLLEGQAENLAYDGNRVEQTSFSVDHDNEGFSVNLDADELGMEALDETINRLSLAASGTPGSHQLTVNLDSSMAALSLEAGGGWDGNGWQGQLRQGEIQSPIGRWQQSQPAGLALDTSGQASLQAYCWQQGAGRLCLEAAMDEQDGLQASMQLESYPLTAFNSNSGHQLLERFHNANGTTAPDSSDLTLPVQLPANAAVSGELIANASVEGVPAEGLQALDINVNIEARDGAMYLQSEQATEDSPDAGMEATIEQIDWENATLQARHQSGRWQLDLDTRFNQEDVANSGIALRGGARAGIAMEADGELDGQVDLNFENIEWVEALVPQIQNSEGRLEGQVNLAGRLDDPAITGNVLLSGVAFDVPVLGIHLDALEAELDSESSGELELTGFAESGGGRLEFSSSVRQAMEPSRSMQLAVQGNQFLLTDREELILRIDPDLRLEATGSDIEMSGELHLPVVDARIESLPETAVGVSSDTVVTTRNADSSTRVTTNDAVPGNIPLSGNVRLSLGDEVHFNGFGLSAQLSGALDINQRPGSSPLTYGELEVVEGQFETYGQVLTIEQGKLLFFGTYDNPAIDIRAVRNVEDLQVGVQMNGTLRNIRSQLFSTPSLPDGDILAVLITGRRLAEIGEQDQQDSNAMVNAVAKLGINQGQSLTDQIRSGLGLDTLAIETSGDNLQESNLTLGKYITPRIFVRYAVGLFQAQNTLAIDYSISENVKLEARSGQDQSLDLTYTIER